MLKMILAVNGAGMIDFKPPKADLQRFAALTIGGTVIMGRKTWDTLPPKMKPLPHRDNIVLSRTPLPNEPGMWSGQALEWATGFNPDAWIIGGGEIYRQALPLVGRVYISTVADDKTGVVRGPDIDLLHWKILCTQSHSDHTFNILGRK